MAPCCSTKVRKSAPLRSSIVFMLAGAIFTSKLMIHRARIAVKMLNAPSSTLFPSLTLANNAIVGASAVGTVLKCGCEQKLTSLSGTRHGPKQARKLRDSVGRYGYMPLECQRSSARVTHGFNLPIHLTTVYRLFDHFVMTLLGQRSDIDKLPGLCLKVEVSLSHSLCR